ncbi:hypothetical protein REPUB_Repub18cG0112200 [Reevesia pubescens]
MDSTTTSSILSLGNETKLSITSSDVAVDALTAASAPTAPADVSPNVPKPPKPGDPRYKMDYATFVIKDVYEYDKAEQLCAIRLKILNDLFQYYSPVSGTFHEESSASSQSNVSTIKTEEFVDMVTYSKSKYKRKRVEFRIRAGKIFRGQDFTDLVLNETKMVIDD